MRPEDIDKLFKERLGNSSPTPSGDLWNRLQQRMEEEKEETPQLLLPPKEKRQSFMWISSSVAATLALLLTVGIVFYNVKTGTPEISETMGKEEQHQLQETPVYKNPAAETIASADALTENTPAEKNVLPQATEESPAASNKAEEVVKQKVIAKATPKAVQRKGPAKAETKQATATAEAVLALNKPKEAVLAAPEEVPVPVVKPATPVTLAEAKASANMNAAPIEITIKRSASPQVALAPAEQQSGLDKKTKLAKNIFKQVRNLANGEGVELSELGIRADRIALETQIGKQKISKVIQL